MKTLTVLLVGFGFGFVFWSIACTQKVPKPTETVLEPVPNPEVKPTELEKKPPLAGADPPSETAADKPVLPAKLANAPIPDPGPNLKEVLSPTKKSLHRAFRKDWPPKAWVSAKAFTYNFVPYHPPIGHLRIFDGEWNTAIKQTINLSKGQAEAAVELTHRTAGGVDASKCAFPRHAVVFLMLMPNQLAVSMCAFHAQTSWSGQSMVPKMCKRKNIQKSAS
jgi:hypothetical protein